MFIDGQISQMVSVNGDKKGMCPDFLSVEHVLGILAVDKSLTLFNIIAAGSSSTHILKNKLELTRRQYYSRLSALVKAGVIKRGKGRNYYLSSFGKVVYDAQVIIGKALQNYWKLEAIDSVELPDLELNKIIEVLIQNPEIKKSLTREARSAIINSANAVEISKDNSRENVGRLPNYAFS
jgi:hypothetical protein